MKLETDFCDRESEFYHMVVTEECDYTEEGEKLAEEERGNEPSLIPIYGAIQKVESVYSGLENDCIELYDITIQSEVYGEVHFIVSAGTYMVDCLYDEVGLKVVGFFDPMLPMPLIYPPRYQIRVLALDLPGRLVKADFYDCFLVSQDNQLRLEITNNTYILSEEDGAAYCDNISNRFLVVLYDRSTKSIPAITQPNVVIVLK